MSAYTILVVDDEYPARKRICRMLEQSPEYTVIGEARNGAEGFRLYHEKKPDIVMTDIEMPVMNGLEMIRKIREEDSRQIVVILTCYESFSYAQEAIRCKVQDYLIKDFTQEQQMKEVLSRNTAVLREETGNLRDLRTDLRSPEKIPGISEQSVKEIEKELGQLALGFLSHSFSLCRNLIVGFCYVTVQGFSQYCFLQYILDMLVTWMGRECVQYDVPLWEVTGEYRSPLDVLNQEPSLEAAVQVVLGWLDRLFSSTEVVSFSPRISNIILYISDHYAEELTLQALSDTFHISPVHLSRSFKAETGKNIITYINIIRIEKSKLLLASGHYQVSEIAYMVGFHNVQNYHNTFKKLEGSSPTEFAGRLFNGGS